jgi:hypothetical protein
MASNRTDNVDDNKVTPRGTTNPLDTNKDTEKPKKDTDSDTRNSGFRSSRIREKESRTSDTGDPSVS